MRRNSILILDSIPEQGQVLRMDELMLRVELERRGHKVTSMHCGGEGFPRLRRIGGSTYLEYAGYEMNLSPTLALGDDDEKRIAASVLEERMAHPELGLRIEKRDDGMYAVYPPVRVDISTFDGVIYHPGSRVTAQAPYALTLLAELEKAGVVPLNPANAVMTSRSKIASHAAFIAHGGLPLPRTACFRRGEGYDEEKCRQALDEIGSRTFVVKNEHGTEGTNVHYAENKEEAMDTVRKVLEAGDGVVVQEEIPLPPGGRRYIALRLTVLDGEVVGALNTRCYPVLSPLQKQVAIETAEAAGQRFAGVDLGGTPDNPVVFETNSCPAFMPHEDAGHGVVARVVDNFLARIQEKQRETPLRRAG